MWYPSVLQCMLRMLFLFSFLLDFGKGIILIKSVFGNSQSIYGYHYRLGCTVRWATWCDQTNSKPALTALREMNEAHTWVGFMCICTLARQHFPILAVCLALSSHSTAQFDENPSTLTHTCSAAPQNPLHKTSVCSKSPIRCETCCFGDMHPSA